jgi:cell division protein FtsL
MIIALAIIVTVLFTAYIYLANAIKIYELDQQTVQIAQEIENEKIRSNQLDEQVKQMGSKNYVENFARKYLGLYYPDETIIIVETQENAAESDGQTVEQ